MSMGVLSQMLTLLDQVNRLSPAHFAAQEAASHRAQMVWLSASQASQETPPRKTTRMEECSRRHGAPVGGAHGGQSCVHYRHVPSSGTTTKHHEGANDQHVNIETNKQTQVHCEPFCYSEIRLFANYSTAVVHQTKSTHSTSKKTRLHVL